MNGLIHTMVQHTQIFQMTKKNRILQQASYLKSLHSLKQNKFYTLCCDVTTVRLSILD